MILILIILIFISKVSLAFIPIMPRELGPVIFQAGMHPYINIGLCSLFGGAYLIKWFWIGGHEFSQSRFFRFYLIMTSFYLIFITVLQCFFVNSDESMILQVGSSLMAVFTIFLFGRVLPTSLEPSRFVLYLKNITVALCWLSLILLFVSSGTSFKGGRFIGLFKHIPHMVSCSTIACFSLFYFLFYKKSSRLILGFHYLSFLVALLLLLLTGTRSSLAAVILGLFLCFIFFKSSSNAIRVLKFSIAVSGLMAVLFFGESVTEYAIDVARGQQNIGDRAAQDGVKSRWEEVERGFEIFQKNQWLGQGLLSKFSNGNDADVAGYNANKDPHNMFISAGVIGGWGFIFLVTLGYGALLVASFKTLKSKNAAMKILAIYMICHIPILFIYHIHLSIGGIADRIYWMVFGYMALKED